MAIKERVLIRKPGLDDGLLTELEKTATDRIKLRLGLNEFPAELESVAVEVICAMHNRTYHEGIKSEDVDDSFRVSFVDDILDEYELDFSRYLSMKKNQENTNRGVLRFL